MLKNNALVKLFSYCWKYSSNKKLFAGFVFLSVIANLIMICEPLIIGRVFNSIQFTVSDPQLFILF